MTVKDLEPPIYVMQLSFWSFWRIVIVITRQELFDVIYILVALQYLQIERVVNRVRFVEEILNE